MNWQLLLTCLLIALARVTDMTLDTIRTVAIVQGRRVFAALLGFIEALVYIVAVAKVLQNFDHFVYAIAYAVGFAAGTFLGITLENRLALGEQLVEIFTHKLGEVAATLRDRGYRITEFQGRGRDGAVSALFIKVPRKQTMKLVADARDVDGDCFYLVHDIRFARRAAGGKFPNRTKIAA